MAVRWLLFDVGGVLADVDDATWPREFVARWAEVLGLAEEDFTTRVEAAALPEAMLRDDDVEEEYWQRYARAVGADAPTLGAMRADFWDAYCGQPDRELQAALEPLRSKFGWPSLSNSGDGARREEERRFKFSARFDPICYSRELGVAKPDRRAFEAALTAMGTVPGDVLFVDDAPVCIEGARALGMAAVLHESNAQTIAVIQHWATTR